MLNYKNTSKKKTTFLALLLEVMKNEEASFGYLETLGLHILETLENQLHFFLFIQSISQVFLDLERLTRL